MLSWGLYRCPANANYTIGYQRKECQTFIKYAASLPTQLCCGNVCVSVLLQTFIMQLCLMSISLYASRCHQLSDFRTTWLNNVQTRVITCRK